MYSMLNMGFIFDTDQTQVQEGSVWCGSELGVMHMV
jgi:hypothetical protein